MLVLSMILQEYIYLVYYNVNINTRETTIENKDTVIKRIDKK